MRRFQACLERSGAVGLDRCQCAFAFPWPSLLRRRFATRLLMSALPLDRSAASTSAAERTASALALERNAAFLAPSFDAQEWANAILKLETGSSASTAASGDVGAALAGLNSSIEELNRALRGEVCSARFVCEADCARSRPIMPLCSLTRARSARWAARCRRSARGSARLTAVSSGASASARATVTLAGFVGGSLSPTLRSRPRSLAYLGYSALRTSCGERIASSRSRGD